MPQKRSDGRVESVPWGDGLLTDLYQLTMASGYWRRGLAEREAVFQLYFRRPPCGDRWALACGQQPACRWLEQWRFESEAIDYLSSLSGATGRPLFDNAFLSYLAELRFQGDVDGPAEGTVVYAREPLFRVQAPLIVAQLIESVLLNLINFQTLIATNAAGVCAAAGDTEVLEFGLRRAQGVDGALSASRAAYVGGCAATSNVLAGRRFGIPVRGTHAHSWVLCFEDEPAAFSAYADVMPDNCVLLVDTYHTIEGVRHAIDVAGQLQSRGRRLLGIRLDSGDLATLSRQARSMLDEAGLDDVRIVVSNDLDAERISGLRRAGAPIDSWGVGTRLVTGYHQPALGGVYKLAALRGADGRWQRKWKRSDDPEKRSLPGVLEVVRYTRDGSWQGDWISDRLDPAASSVAGVDQQGVEWSADPSWNATPLLQPLMRNGRRVGSAEKLVDVRSRGQTQVASARAVPTANTDGDYPIVLDPRISARTAKPVPLA